MSEYINMSIFEYFLSEKRQKFLYSGYRIAMAQIYIFSPETPKINIFPKITLKFEFPIDLHIFIKIDSPFLRDFSIISRRCPIMRPKVGGFARFELK